MNRFIIEAVPSAPQYAGEETKTVLIEPVEHSNNLNNIYNFLAYKLNSVYNYKHRKGC